jgi:prepilin-type N-terminal cleavage/methylation domain-containing protein
MFISEISKINSFGSALRKRKDFASHKVSGFTLIEIIIVVVILSIAAMAAIPLMSSASDVQIRSAANLIAADLEYAKSMAISRGQYYSVVFDEGENSYGIYKVGETDPIQHPVKKGFPYVMNFSNDSRLGKVDITNINFDGISTVEFDCLGSPDEGGSIILNANGITATITVEPVTGYISISL